ncbi:O-methyltransferase [Pirellulaceae bacterium SH449]
MGSQTFVSKWRRSIAKRLPGYQPPTAPGNSSVGAIPEVPFLVPSATFEEIFPGGDHAEVTMLPRLIRSHKWAMPEHELLTLGALTKVLQPKMVVEFGTFMGGSTLSMVANMPAEGRIITIDLDPRARKTHVHGMGVGLSEFDVGCLFRGTRYEDRIEQRFANLVQFEDDGLTGKADFVFVDADHTYEFVKRDTQRALRFLKPGGSILWHDYTWEPKNSECVGVTKAVNEFWEEHGSCSQIAGTRFVVFTPSLASKSKLTGAA